VAAAVGLQRRGWIPFSSAFAAFLTSRPYDFIRMAAISSADIKLVGSHSGISVGEDGPSQMALEDIALIRALHGSTVLHPCDANQTAALVGEMVHQPGIVYLRTLRPATEVIYAPEERFSIGGCRILRSSPVDVATVVAAGITVHEALAAADLLEAEHLPIRVIDAYSVKPLDAATIHAAGVATGRVVVAEDHRPSGGLADAVAEVFDSSALRPQLVRLGVRIMPTSGRAEELLAAAGIDRNAIARAVRRLPPLARPVAATNHR
jgi:transketolase